MTKVVFENHAAVRVRRTERDRIRAFHRMIRKTMHQLNLWTVCRPTQQ